MPDPVRDDVLRDAPTRLELLRRQRDGLRSARRRSTAALAFLQAVPGLLALAGAAVGVALVLEPDGGRHAGWALAVPLLVVAVLGLGWAVRADARRLAVRTAWRRADRIGDARRLSLGVPGPGDERLLTPFDRRDDAGLLALRRRDEVDPGRSVDPVAVVVDVVLALIVLLPLAGLGALLLADRDDASRPLLLALLAGVLLLPGAWFLARLALDAPRWWAEVEVRRLDVDLLLARRAMLHGGEARPLLLDADRRHAGAALLLLAFVPAAAGLLSADGALGVGASIVLGLLTLLGVASAARALPWRWRGGVWGIDPSEPAPRCIEQPLASTARALRLPREGGRERAAVLTPERGLVLLGRSLAGVLPPTPEHAPSPPVLLPDGRPLPATRGELLRARAERVEAAQARALPLRWRRGLEGLPWVLLGAGAGWLAGIALTPGAAGPRAVAAGLAVALALTAAAGLARARRDHRRLTSVATDWALVERTVPARALPAGDVDPATATAFDLRDDPLLREHRVEPATRRVSAYYQAQVLYLLALAVMIVAGVVLALGPIVSDSSTGVRVGCLIAAAFLLVPSIWTLGGVAGGYDAGPGWLERDVLLLRQDLLGISPAQSRETLSVSLRLAFITVNLLGVGVVVLVAATRLSGAELLGVVAFLAVLYGSAFALIWMRQRRRRGVRLWPLLQGEQTVLEGTRHRRVRLDLTDATLRITPADAGESGRVAVELPLADLLAVVDVPRTEWSDPPTVAVLTSATPVVLVGRDVAQDPAILALRERLSPEGA